MRSDMLTFVFQLIKKKHISGKKRCFDAAHVFGTSFHALRCPAVFGVEMKIYERSLQALLSLPHPPLSRLLSSIKFSRYPQMEWFLAG